MSLGPSIWGTPIVSSFHFAHIPIIPMPILSITMPMSGFPSSGGPSLGFNMGSGIPSTSTIPMSGPVTSSANFPFRWNIPSGFGTVPSQCGGSNAFGGFSFHGLAPLSLGGNFHNGVAIHSSIHSILGASSLGIVLEIIFL
jgi:hypothetical protein